MKFVLVFLIVISPITDLNEVARINEHKKAGNEAFQNGEFELAAQHYQFLVDSLDVREESVLLNLANALFNLQDTSNARNIYNSVVNEGLTKKSKSIAHQQLGLMDYGGKKYKEALGRFKNAIKNDPANEEARYNYELLKKLIEEQEENQEQQDQQNEDQQQENKDQEQKDQENQDQQNQENQENQEKKDQENQQEQENQENQEQQQQQEQKEGEEQQPEEGEESEENPENTDPTTAEKLKEMNISEEKAKMILEALKNNEVQYIQQNKRKAKQKKKDGKPDW